MRPLAIDLFCGLGGWTEGLLAEGYRVVGFDVERHVYGEARYPAQLVLQNVLTIHGRQFKDAALIVASPPCQAYSYRAMPWKRAKALPPPDNSLFEACFRIQREAMAATRKECHCNGHIGNGWDKDQCWCCFGSGFCPGTERFIPLVVENVRGAQPYVGRARWHFGSFYLWGDVPALMPMRKKKVQPAVMFSMNCDTCGHSATVHEEEGRCGIEECRCSHFNQADDIEPEAVKAAKDGLGGYGGGFGWDDSPMRRGSSKSTARKAASAHIAKIPTVLARHIARAWYPHVAEQSA